MKHNFTMTTFFIIISFLLYFQSSDTKEISWHENHKLKWTDFKGKPDENSNSAAITASGITFSYSIQKTSSQVVTSFKTKVFAHFYPEESWCKKNLIDNHILTHEQFHFNITELHVRYFREKIATLSVSNAIEKELTKAHKKANNDLEAMQHLYDTETNYSIDREGQQKWNALVNKELKRLEKYKSN